MTVPFHCFIPLLILQGNFNVCLFLRFTLKVCLCASSYNKINFVALKKPLSSLKYENINWKWSIKTWVNKRKLKS